jgi:hypothetical protein
MDIKIFTSMFEDLKKIVLEQNKTEFDYSKIKEMLETNISNVIQASNKSLFQENVSANIQLKEDILKMIKDNTPDKFNNEDIVEKLAKMLDYKLDGQIEQIQEVVSNNLHTPLPQQKHLHTLEIKSSKVVISLISISVALFLSLISNWYQFASNLKLNDNDIKYRYIKALGEINTKQLLDLETIFEFSPNKQAKRTIRNKVIEHERKVAQRAKELEKARLKEEQAERLQKEAEEIKGRK